MRWKRAGGVRVGRGGVLRGEDRRPDHSRPENGHSDHRDRPEPDTPERDRSTSNRSERNTSEPDRPVSSGPGRDRSKPVRPERNSSENDRSEPDSPERDRSKPVRTERKSSQNGRPKPDRSESNHSANDHPQNNRPDEPHPNPRTPASPHPTRNRHPNRNPRPAHPTRPRPAHPRRRHPRPPSPLNHSTLPRYAPALARGRAVLRWVPPVLIVIGMAFYWMSPPGLTSSPFYESAPLIAAPLYSFGGTAIIGASAVMADVALEILNGTAQEPEAITEMISTLILALIALAVNRLAREYGERLASARYISEAAQRAVLPDPDDNIGGLQVAARYLAADADARIGGDMYAVQDSPYGVRIIVGDVRGKGLDAVEAVAVVIGAFREAAEQEPDLGGVARRLEHALQREGVRREGLDKFEGFTTAVLAEIAEGTEVLRVLNRGHPPPLVLYANGDVALVEPDVHSLPLGMGELGVWPDETDEQPFPPGAMLVLYTDGVTEARDTRGVFYEPAERMRGRIFRGPEQLLDGLVDDVSRHTGGTIADDMALIAVCRSCGQSAVHGT